MTRDEAVLEFIALSRKSIDNKWINKDDEKRIKQNFESILDAVIVDYQLEELPRLIICNTYNKYSEILPIKKGEKKGYYLLYDVHLSEINHLLNSLFYTDNNNGHDIWKFAYELFAEEALLSKDEVMTIYYSLNKMALGPYNIFEYNKDAMEFILDIQEKYIIAHEIGHWIYEMIKGEEYKNSLNFVDLKVVLTDIQNILHEIYLQYGKLFCESEYKAIIDEQSNIIHSSNRIVEECFSDAIAYSFVFDFIKKEYNNEINVKLNVGKNLFILMLNLQLLAMHHMTVAEESFENATSIRLAFFRNYVGLYFENDENIFNRLLEITVEKYEKKITTLALECFNELENRRDNIYSEFEKVIQSQ